MNRSRKILTALYVVAALAYVSCVNTMSDSVDLNERPEDDRSYLKAYDHATRDEKVVVNFETRFTVSATYLSPEFRAAFARRFEKLFNAPQPFLEEASNKAGFFVSIFSPERDGYDLTNDQLWSIQLRTEDRAHKPILVKRLDNKSRWRPFFLDVNNWSDEYLILFDSPSVSMDEKLVNKAQIKLLLANADARVTLAW
jgi:hypothetical protein